MAELVILVNGVPGAGKSTLAAPLARELGVPLVSKDSIKEAIADAVDARLATSPLGAIASDAMWAIAAMLDGTVMIESFWATGRDERFLRDGLRSLGDPPGLEVWCHAPAGTMRERFISRARHAAHADSSRLAEWSGYCSTAKPVSGLPVVDVDTGHAVDLAALASRIVRSLDDRAHDDAVAG